MIKEDTLKRIIISVICILSGFVSMYADGFPNTNKAKETIENAINVFTNQKFEEAANMLKPYWPMNPVSIDNLAVQAKQQWGLISDNYGKKIDVEYIRTETIGKSLIKYTHLVRFEKYALRFETILYNSPNGWVITSFNFDDKIGELFNK
jgi:hypothetical protein